MKKASALLLFSLTLLALAVFTTSAASQTSPTLYSYYDDDMLFKQQDEAVFSGKAAPGSEITCTLLNSRNEVVTQASAVTPSDGVFSLSFTAPAGGFEEYTAVLRADGEIFRELKGIVFGELWLAGGQSNMQLSLISSKTGGQMAAENKRGSDALRFLYVPFNLTYKGDEDKLSAEPLDDFEVTTGWYRGSDIKVFELSAVGYYFAESLIKELNMPVGILHACLGGTSIRSWLPRAAIEGDPALLEDVKSDNRYIPLGRWREDKADQYTDMTVNFNRFIAPLKSFRLSGMLWYQGEGDISWQYGKYTRAFNALQSSYTSCFRHKDGPLPIVFTQLASYSYGNPYYPQNLNLEFADIQRQAPASRAMTSIYDVPLDYTPEAHAIHPLCKKEVGEKMTLAALGLVYDKHDSYTAATPEKAEVKNSSIYVTLRDVGDGLLCDGETLKGFSICSDNGVYLQAKAELVSKDTVRVYSSAVKNPVSVAYACTASNLHANLFATARGEKTLAVSPFITRPDLSYHLWHNGFWTDCDTEKIWHCHSNEYSGFYDTWSVSGAQLSFVKADDGKALRVRADSGSQLSVSPNFTYNANGKQAYFEDIDLNWSDYKSLTFSIRVNSSKAVHFDGLKILSGGGIWVMPTIKDSKETGCIIESDGCTHRVTLNLNSLYPFGTTDSSRYRSDLLSRIYGAELLFTGTGEEAADITLDNFEFSTEVLPDNDTTESKSSFFDKIRAFFISVYSKIVLFFERLF